MLAVPSRAGQRAENNTGGKAMKALGLGRYSLFSVKYGHHPAITIRASDIERAPINAWTRCAFRYGWGSREDFIKNSVVKER
jgi:hypothetical protein